MKLWSQDYIQLMEQLILSCLSALKLWIYVVVLRCMAFVRPNCLLFRHVIGWEGVPQSTHTHTSRVLSVQRLDLSLDTTVLFRKLSWRLLVAIRSTIGVAVTPLALSEYLLLVIIQWSRVCSAQSREVWTCNSDDDSEIDIDRRISGGILRGRCTGSR